MNSTSTLLLADAGAGEHHTTNLLFNELCRHLGKQIEPIYAFYKKIRRWGLTPMLYRTELFRGFQFLEQNPFINPLVNLQILWKCNKVINISGCLY